MANLSLVYGDLFSSIAILSPKIHETYKLLHSRNPYYGEYVFYMMIQFQMAGVYDFLYLPLIMIGYVCQVRPYLWIGMITSVMVFLTGTALGDQFTEHFISAFINTALFYMIGFSLGRITVINNKNKELIQSIQEKIKR